MVNKNKIAIISSGNGGQSMAAYFAHLGYSVSLYVREQERVEMFPPSYTFKIRGIIEDEVTIDCISTDMAEVIKDAYLIMVTTPAQYHPFIARKMSSCLDDGQIVVLNPGRTFGTYVFTTILKEQGNTKDVIIGEAETFVFACRCIEVAKPIIHGIKNVVRVAAHDPKDTKKVVEAMSKVFPEVIKAAKTTLHTSFTNIGMIFHPLPILLNITRVETSENFRFYVDGITPLVANIIEQMDQERVTVAKAYGVEVQSVFEWLGSHYGSRGDTLYERIQNTNAYTNIFAPTDIDTRYIYEDILTGCVPLYYAGKAVGINTKIINSAILWASTIYGKDFKKEGRNEQVIDFDELVERYV